MKSLIAVFFALAGLTLVLYVVVAVLRVLIEVRAHGWSFAAWMWVGLGLLAVLATVFVGMLWRKFAIEEVG